MPMDERAYMTGEKAVKKRLKRKRSTVQSFESLLKQYRKGFKAVHSTK